MNWEEKRKHFMFLCRERSDELAAHMRQRDEEHMINEIEVGLIGFLFCGVAWLIALLDPVTEQIGPFTWNMATSLAAVITFFVVAYLYLALSYYIGRDPFKPLFAFVFLLNDGVGGMVSIGRFAKARLWSRE